LDADLAHCPRRQDLGREGGREGGRGHVSTDNKSKEEGREGGRGTYLAVVVEDGNLDGAGGLAHRPGLAGAVLGEGVGGHLGREGGREGC